MVSQWYRWSLGVFGLSCVSGVLVVFLWCLGGVFVEFCGVSVMSWWCLDGNQDWQSAWQSPWQSWCLGGVSVVFWWCLRGVSVMSW